MNVVVIYESLTGNTRQVALAVRDALFDHSIRCRTFPRSAIDHEEVAAADLVVVGTWTDGLLVVGQRPGRARRLRQSLPSLEGKRCAVYCTYAVTPGGTLPKLQQLVEGAGGDVLGGLAIRRDDLTGGARRLVDGIIDVALV